MEHVFYVHSGITEKVARAVISHEGINKYKLLSARQYDPGEDGGLNVDDAYQLSDYRFNVLRNWAPIFNGDRIVNRVINDDFHLYVPQTAVDRIRLLLSHRLCKGFSIIEEGLMSYCSREQCDAIVPAKNESLIRQIAYLRRLGRREFFRRGYNKVYAHQNSAFPDFANKEIINIEFEPTPYNKKIGPDDCILACESIKYMDNEKLCNHIKDFITSLNLLKQKYDVVHYKLHPSSHEDWEEEFILETFSQNNIVSKKIPSNICLEDVAITTDVDVVVDLSSTGLYCGIHSNANAYSFHAISKGKKYAKKISKIKSWPPSVFWQHVKPLTECKQYA